MQPLAEPIRICLATGRHGPNVLSVQGMNLQKVIWTGTDLPGSGEDGLLARINPKKK